MSDLDDPRPVAPIQPDLDDCCNRGCYPCIFDVYDDAMDHYRAALKLWESRHAPKPRGLFSRLKKPKAP